MVTMTREPVAAVSETMSTGRRSSREPSEAGRIACGHLPLAHGQ